MTDDPTMDAMAHAIGDVCGCGDEDDAHRPEAEAALEAFYANPPAWLIDLVALADAVNDRVGWLRAEQAIAALPERLRTRALGGEQ